MTSSKSEWYLYVWNKKTKAYAVSSVAVGRDIVAAKVVADHYTKEYPKDQFVIKLIRTEIVLV